MKSQVMTLLRKCFAFFIKYPVPPPLGATKLEIGTYGENYCQVYLMKKGYHVLEKNLRFYGHEIDIVAEKNNLLVFVEVKTRTYFGNRLSQYGRPSNAVNLEKRKHIRHAASVYIKHIRKKYRFRFDIMEVYLTPSENQHALERICHIEDAFR